MTKTQIEAKADFHAAKCKNLTFQTWGIKMDPPTQKLYDYHHNLMSMFAKKLNRLNQSN